jgi:FkbM family methyltransferase
MDPSQSIPGARNDPEALLHVPGNSSLGDLVKFTVARYGRFLSLANDGISQILRLYGEWAQPEVELLLHLIQPGNTVLDIGANLGTLTVPLAKRVGPTGRVIAFEAQPAIHMLLCANLALNELLSVRALNVAVSDETGYVDMPNLDYGMYYNFGGVSFAEQRAGQSNGSSRIACHRLDDLVADLPECHLIKVDVEGMESRVLEGGEAFIMRTRPIIYSEADRRSSFNRLIAVADRMKYRAYWHCFRGYNTQNFFATPDNVYGPGGDINLLLVPNESHPELAGRVARHFDEVFELMPGVTPSD